ncbi:unnamed protein product [Leptosia nina]|uniref:Uncharacterized protein n=1 Tax=Leptosia nina TaxID=320188 RepID=A0AAV1JSX3_9NEOP
MWRSRAGRTVHSPPVGTGVARRQSVTLVAPLELCSQILLNYVPLQAGRPLSLDNVEAGNDCGEGFLVGGSGVDRAKIDGKRGSNYVIVMLGRDSLAIVYGEDCYLHVEVTEPRAVNEMSQKHPSVVTLILTSSKADGGGDSFGSS